VVHHRPGKRYPLCRSLLVRWKLHGPGKRRRRRDGIAQSNWKAQPNHRASPSELLPKSHNCMKCITFSTNFRRWVDQNWLEMVWDRALEAGNGGVRLWIFASTHSFTTALDMTSHWVGRWAGRAEEFREGGKDCNFFGHSGSTDEYILASVSSSSSSSAAAASLFLKPGCPFLPEKDLCRDRMVGNPVFNSGRFLLHVCHFHCSRLILLKMYIQHRYFPYTQKLHITPPKAQPTFQFAPSH
jgi:hypothetical protein